MILDEAMMAFLASEGPNPSQGDLDQLFAGTTRVRVLDGETIDGRAQSADVLVETEDPARIAELRDALVIRSEDGGHCMCHGSQSIEFYAGTELRATIGIHHGLGIRWNAWKPDARLAFPGAPYAWIDALGTPGPLRSWENERRDSERRRQAEAAWWESAPACVRFVRDEPGDWRSDVARCESALAFELPDASVRAATLMRWYGSSRSAWSGYPAYEGFASELLLRLPIDALVTAASRVDADDDLLEGATRLFASWEFGKQRRGERARLPVALKERLLAHALSRGDADRNRRAEMAFR